MEPKVNVQETDNFKEVEVSSEESVSKVFIGGQVIRMLHVDNKSYPMYEWVMFEDGRAAKFDRLAQPDSDGMVDLAQFNIGEFVIRPGIVYKRCEPTTEMMQKYCHKTKAIQEREELRTRGTELAKKGLIIPKKYRR